MGNLCGKQSNDPFAGPGRTLGSAQPPHQRTTAPIPTQQERQRASQGRGRTVGGMASSSDDAKAAAARAAEERAQQKIGTGPLGKKLDKQKKETWAKTREQDSQDTRRGRDADAAAEARHYN